VYHDAETGRPLFWLGASRTDLRVFPAEARLEAGRQLRRVQQGLLPDDWKPLPGIGAGVRELRVHTGREHRVIYLARFAEAVYVLHAFEKRTRKTRQADVEIARMRFRELTRPRPLR
jgi:phage-related protein